MTIRAEAIKEFEQRVKCDDAARVVGSLDAGLSTLGDLLYTRMHKDVESNVGRDSMFLPVSDIKTARLTKTEVELFQLAESDVAARQRQYVHDDDWYLQWLVRLRLAYLKDEPSTGDRLAKYVSETSDSRRLAFTDALAKVLPDSNRAPLVLFRLMPLAVRGATAVAFGDQPHAAELREQQRRLLPAIADCRRCGAGVLENGDLCLDCGNPLWKYQWLVAAD